MENGRLTAARSKVDAPMCRTSESATAHLAITDEEILTRVYCSSMASRTRQRLIGALDSAQEMELTVSSSFSA